jgi:hypothetical protein
MPLFLRQFEPKNDFFWTNLDVSPPNFSGHNAVIFTSTATATSQKSFSSEGASGCVTCVDLTWNDPKVFQ